MISNITNQTNISMPTNITNITMPENVTAITNETVPVAGSGTVISSDTYVLPDMCSYFDDTNTKVCCDNTDLN
jgi:aspartate carbamoyltransferase regulatory subunit